MMQNGAETAPFFVGLSLNAKKHHRTSPRFRRRFKYDTGAAIWKALDMQ